MTCAKPISFFVVRDGWKQVNLLRNTSSCKNRVLMVFKRTLLVFLTLLATLAYGHSEKEISLPTQIDKPIFKRLTADDGLNQNLVRSLATDADGFLWLGTQNGLARYDGYQVDIIDGKNNQFSNTVVVNLLVDSQNRLWVGAVSTSLMMMDLHTKDIRPIVSILPDDNQGMKQTATSILEDNGRIWVSRMSSVVSYDVNTLQQQIHFKLEQDPKQQTKIIREIAKYKDTLFVATSNGLYGVNLLNGTSKQFKYANTNTSGITARNMRTLKMASNNQLLVGSGTGLYRLDADKANNYLQNDQHAPELITLNETEHVLDILEYAPGVFYLATQRGLSMYLSADDSVSKVFLPSSGEFNINDDTLTSLIVDSNSKLWMGSASEGALYWRPLKIRFTELSKTVNNGRFSNSRALSLAQTKPDEIWIGTQQGLNRYNLATHTNYSFVNNKNNAQPFNNEDVIRQIFPQGQDGLVLVTPVGMRYFDATENRVKELPLSNDEFANQARQALPYLSQDQQGNILFANDNGFFMYFANSQYIEAMPLLTEKIEAADVQNIIAVDKYFAGKYWICTQNSIIEYDSVNQSASEVYSVPRAAINQAMFANSVAMDNNGILWVAYSGLGLLGFDAKSLEQRYFFNRDNGLPSNSIFSLLSDDQGHVWMSSVRGLVKLNTNSLVFSHFDKTDGLETKEYIASSVHKMADGRFAFGSYKGVTLFDPNEPLTMVDEIDAITTRVVISSVSLFSKELDLPLTSLANMQFDLDHDDNGLQINFSALNFDPSTEYQYDLVSRSETISSGYSKDAMVMFPKLKPGSYEFRVRSKLNHSSREGRATVLYLNVAHAPLFSPLAYALYTLLLLLALYIWYKRNKKQRETLERARQIAVDSEKRLSMALDASSSGVWEYYLAGDIYRSERLVKDLGYKKRDVKHSLDSVTDLMHPSDKQRYINLWNQFLEGKVAKFDTLYRIRVTDGEWLWYRDVGSIVSDSGMPTQVAGTYTNVTESMVNREKARLFGESFKHTRDWVIVFDPSLKTVATNQAFDDKFSIKDSDKLDEQVKRVLGESSGDNDSFWEMMRSVDPHYGWQGEQIIIQPSGEIIYTDVHVTPVHDESNQELENYLVIFSDITQHKEAEENLRKIANFDSLTNLPNRALLVDRIQHSLEQAKRNHKQNALMFIDLDRFKQVNDTMGHDAGDELLQVVAKRLKSVLRETDTIARIGGDEFVVLLENFLDIDKVSHIAAEVMNAIETPVALRGQQIGISASIGITLSPDDGDTPLELLKNADIAMYQAKHDGRSTFKFFTTEMNERARERMQLETKIKNAHANREFVNHYQPIVDAMSGSVNGFELLMRWPSDEGMIPPTKFIPIAEEVGLIGDMTWHALHRSIPILKQWHEQNPNIYLSVNLSARHFESKTSVEEIVSLLELNELPVSVFRFEITESALMLNYVRAQSYMSEMKKCGFNIALDDFGTGYSSLKYLKEFPIDIIKIDKSFVQDIGVDANDEAIVLAVLKMAESLGLTCVAEGIETESQVEFMRKHKCAQLQGYYFSKPIIGDMSVKLTSKTLPL